MSIILALVLMLQMIVPVNYVFAGDQEKLAGYNSTSLDLENLERELENKIASSNMEELDELEGQIRELIENGEENPVLKELEDRLLSLIEERRKELEGEVELEGTEGEVEDKEDSRDREDIPSSTGVGGEDISESFQVSNFEILEKGKGSLGDKTDLTSILNENNSFDLILLFEWKIDRGNIRSGDFIEYELPKGLELGRLMENNDYNLDIADRTVGRITINEAGHMKIVFEEDLDLEDLAGEIEISYEIKKEDFDNTDGIIAIEDGGKKWEFIYTDYQLEKTGKKIEGDFIEWEVTINPNKQDIGDVMLVDELPEALSFVEGSMTISPEGSLTAGNSPKLLVFNGVKDRITVKYRTKIGKKENATYINKAYLKVANTIVASATGEVNVEREVDLTKSGSIEKGVEDGKKKAKWTIEVNKNKDAFKELNIEDIIPPGHKLWGGKENFKIEPNINSDRLSETEQGFKIDFGDTDQKYTIDYYTEFEVKDIPAGMSKDYTNKVRARDGDSIIKDSQATVNYYKQKSINKWYTDIETIGGDKYINWTISLTLDDDYEDGLTIKDSIGSGMELDKDSISLVDYTGQEVSWENKDLKDDEFTLEIEGPLVKGRQIAINYRTKIIDYGINFYLNHAEIHLGGNKVDEIDAGVSQNLFSSSLDKTVDAIDYKNHKIKWRVELDTKKGRFEYIKLTDSLLENLKLTDKPQIEIEIDGKKLSKDDYTIKKADREFVIDINKSGLEKQKDGLDHNLKLTYESEMKEPDDGSKNEVFKNKIVADINTEKGEINTLEDIAESEIAEIVEENGIKSGELREAERKIRWTVHSRPFADGKILNNQVFKDRVGDGQSIDRDSLRLFSYRLEEDGSTSPAIEELKPEEYEINWIEGGNKNETVGFHVTVFKVYTPIMFSYDSNLIGITKDKYRNIFEDRGKILEAEVSSPDADEYLSKKASDRLGKDIPSGGSIPAGNYINWSVDINKSRSELHNLIFEDQLSSDQRLVEDSLVLEDGDTGRIIDLDGKVSIENSDKGSSIKIDIGYINSYHKLSYKTQTRNIKKEEDKKVKVGNKARLIMHKDDQALIGDEGKLESLVEDIELQWKGGGTGSGEKSKGSVTIYKLDKDKNLIVKDSARFKLKKDNEEKEYETKDGKVHIDNLEFGDYTLEEIKAPDGYIQSKSPIKFTLKNNDYDKDIEIDLVNLRADGAIKISKVDGDTDKPLSGAEFTIKDEKNRIVSVIVTDASGRAEAKLPYGSYTIEETKAPEGFTQLKGFSKFEISESKKEIKVTVPNTKEVKPRIDLRIRKVDQDNEDIKLKGARFDVYDSLDKKIGEIETDEEGYGELPNLDYGKYRLKETKAPDGYDQLEEDVLVILMGQGLYDPAKESPKSNIGNESAKGPIFKIRNAKQKGSLKILKVDSDGRTPLEGAEFKLSGEGDYQIKTDRNGLGEFKNLPLGSYKLEEVKAPDGYKKLDNPIDVEVTGENKRPLIIKNSKLEGSLEILKQDSEDKLKKLAGAEFEIRDEENRLIDDSLVTDESGKIVTNLPVGSYLVKETKAPEGYLLPIPAKTIKVEIKDSETTRLEVENYQDKDKIGLLEVLKIDEEGKPLANAEFDVYRDDGVGPVASVKTNNEGRAEAQLAYGKYKLKEIKAPEGYKLLEEMIDTEVSGARKGLITEIKNEKLMGTIKLSKVDSEDRKIKLGGARFEVQDEKGRKQGEIVTDDKGEGSIDLPLGKYRLVELEAPEGYQLPIPAKTINVEIGREGNKGEIKEIEVENYKESEKLGILELKKIDEDGNPLRGAEFEVLDRDGRQLVASIITDESGQGKISLPYGVYQLKEVRAPKGYKLKDQLIEVEVTGNRNPLITTIKNEKIMGRIDLIKVDGEDESKKLAGAEFELRDDKDRLIDTLVTDEKGRAGLDLPLGRYHILETKAPEGYGLPVPARTLTIDLEEIGNSSNGEQKEFKLPNYKDGFESLGNLKILKLDKDNNYLPGAEFEIRDKKTNNIIRTIRSNRQGLAELKLPYGEYLIREVKAPFGYQLIDTIYEVEVSQERKNNILSIKNEKIMGSIEVLKFDHDDRGKLLEGAEFEVIDSQGDLVGKLVTGEDGRASMDLPIGRYRLIETKAPSGYQLPVPAKTIDLEIEEVDNVGEDKLIEIENYKNSMVLGILEVLKLDEKDQPLAGAEFDVYREDGLSLVSSIKTDGEGRGKAQLPYGNYKLKERKAPVGYELLEDMVDISVGGQKESLVKTIRNKPIEVSLMVRKINDKNVGLAGAEFNLIKDEQVLETLVTDKKGEAKISGLALGDYRLVETKAPDGYEKLDMDVKFRIDGSSKVKVLNILNRKKGGGPVDPINPIYPEGTIDPNKPVGPEGGDPVKPVEPRPELNKDEHYAYIQGYEDGTMRPEGDISREEIAAIFFRLLESNYRETIRSEESQFKDVNKKIWSNKHIATLEKGKILNGYPDGSFKPRANMTRAELVATLSRFIEVEENAKSHLKDVEGHWAEDFINSGVSKGWIEGYPDGKFYPDKNISRAEAVTLINNILDRWTKEGMYYVEKEYDDLEKGKWYYEAFQEAISSHNYEKLEDGTEHWLDNPHVEVEM